MEIHATKSVQDRSFEFQQAVNTFAKQNHTIAKLQRPTMPKSHEMNSTNKQDK